MTSVTTSEGGFDLEYNDVVHDSSLPENKAIEADIPERYKDKSTDDLIQMHVNLEKVLRRQGNEVGQLRKLVDTQTQLLQTTQAPAFRPGQGAPVEPARAEPVTTENLLTRPEETLQRAVSSNPSVTHANQRIDNLELSLAKKDFESRHPSATADINDPGFQEWVLSSPTRSKLMAALGQHNNFAAGAELWELWGEHRSIQDQAQATQVAQKVGERVQQAKTIKGGSTEVSASKPIYSRTKLAELQLKAASGDPASAARWNDPAFQRDYLLAYAEDRVK